MKFTEKLKVNTREQIWQEYCGFLELSMKDYMFIQRRLMDEQIGLWAASGLGKKLLRGKSALSIDELRRELPLTRYEDYSEVLLAERADMLPAEPIIWIRTTWEGGIHPIKLAPYTRAMLDTYRHNTLAITMLTSIRENGEVNVRPKDRVLYGGAPLPYATGLIPTLLDEDVDFVWLPDANANNLSFSERIKKGFKMAMKGGLDYIFATGSIANYITESFGRIACGTGSSGKKHISISPAIAFKYARAKYLCRRDGRSLTPGDIFKIKGLVCAGTDSKCYRDRLTRAWGVKPIEIAAGTESTCIATETRLHSGMVFFPDACFYEFIPEMEMRKNIEDTGYTPLTCLMDEVRPGESYELVISVLHGGAFMRYRIGDVYRCTEFDPGCLPRFTFIDRVPGIIDIAGFTRITQSSINEVIRLSGLGIGDWLARKEFGENGNPYFHMYVELKPDAQGSSAITRQVLMEHLAVYFKSFDSDYSDLKKLLNMEPLNVTVLKFGTIKGYEKHYNRALSRINPDISDISELLRFQVLSRSVQEEVSAG